MESLRLRMSLTVKPLKAFHGDSILVSFDDNNGTTRNILIDGGPGNTYAKPPHALKNEIEQIKERGESINLLVITHIDDDHIGGIIKMFEYEEINLDIVKKVWFNSGELISAFFKQPIETDRDCHLTLKSNPYASIEQGITLEKSLTDMNCWDRRVIHSGCETVPFHGSIITILSPNEQGLKKLNEKWETEVGEVYTAGDHSDYEIPISELITRPFRGDNSTPNKSSISFLFEYLGKKILFLADSHPTVVKKSLNSLGYSTRNKLEVDMIKVSHHGSRRNISRGLLKIIKCKNYLISTNALMHGLPDKEAIARIIAANREKTCLYFNYDIGEEIFLPEDLSDYNFEWKYLDSKGIELA
jgi:beta-lactamase superfamily II metal-dependent hydrolase